MPKGSKHVKPSGVLSAVFDNPTRFADRCRSGDRSLIAALEAIVQAVPADRVGSETKERVLGLTDQNAGKLMKQLLGLASDDGIGKGLKIIFATCLAKRQR